MPRSISPLLMALALAHGCAGDPTLSWAPQELLQGDGALAAADLGASAETGTAPLVDFVVQGCARRTTVACQGPVPLQLVFSSVSAQNPLSASWDLDAKGPSLPGTVASRTYSTPGTYDVTLSIGVTSGTLSEHKAAFVVAEAVGPGARCSSDLACQSKSCLCSSGCSFPLDQGFCLQPCGDAPCPLVLGGGVQNCVKLASLPGLSTPLKWASLCLPSCASDGDCATPGSRCQPAPTGTSWVNTCLPAGLGGVGESCRGAEGTVQWDRCAGGTCLDMGASGYCTSSCAAGGCPTGSRCGSFVKDPGAPACLRTCATSTDCGDDPLLACELPSTAGQYGYQILGSPPAAGTRFCTPARCTADSDCGLTGTCSAAAGGFCIP